MEIINKKLDFEPPTQQKEKKKKKKRRIIKTRFQQISGLQG